MNEYMIPNKKIIPIGLWLLLVVFLSYLYSHPFDIFSRGAYMNGWDMQLALWILNWQLSHLVSGEFWELFTGNIFYPLEHSVVFSINMLSTVILNGPLFWITGDPEISFNASIHISYILCALGMFFLARRLELDVASAIAASLIFSFSEFRLYFTSHLTLLTMQWMPFTLLFIHKYFAEKKNSWLYLASLFYILQITASAHYAIFFTVILLAFIAILFFQQRLLSWSEFLQDALWPVLITLAVGGMCYLPYLRVTQNFGFSRSIFNQIRYGADLETYLSAAHSYFLGPLTARFGHLEGYASPRFTALFLTATALFLYRAKVGRLSFIRRLDVAFIVVALLSFVIWKTQAVWVPEFVTVFPFAKAWGPKVWQVIILTPVFWLGLIRLCLTGIVRSLFSGLLKQNLFFLYFFIAFFAFLISLGPVVKINGEVWALNPVTTLLFYIFPGFDSIRAISRISGLVPLGLAITSGIGLMLIGQRIQKANNKALLYLFFIGLLLFETYPAKGINPPYKKAEPKSDEYVWLKNQPGRGPVLEWPIHYPFDTEAVYVEKSRIHNKPLVNGFGSYRWLGHRKLGKLKDLSEKEALLSLYAFGVRYLLIHNTRGQFPKWATREIGKFQLSRRFDDTLVYENKNARTRFLPENYWNNFDLAIEHTDNSHCELILTFQSPENSFVSKTKTSLEVRLEGESNRVLEEKELTFFPDLWQNGNKYNIALKKKSCAARKIFFILDEKKRDTRFTPVGTSPGP
jgi:hypothetical protein